MKAFEKYLLNRGYRTKTAKGYATCLNLFFKWCEVAQISPKTACIEDVYDFQSSCRRDGNAPNTILEKIQVVRLYFYFLKRTPNPAILVVSERREKTIPSNLLDEETMLEIYFSFLPRTDAEKRNKCLLGLLLFQGLMRSELGSLEVDYIDFDQSRIYIPSSTKTNERYLDLHRRQVADLEQYVHLTRPQLLKESGKNTNLLFFTQSNSMANGLHNAISILTTALKHDFPYFSSLTQLRSSRISIWVRNNDLRLAQYFSGIKYASSLGRYKRTNIDSLKRKINTIHPLDNLL